MKNIIFAAVAVISLQVVAVPVIQTTGTSSFIVLLCTEEKYAEAKERALEIAKEKAEEICDSEVTLLSIPLLNAECRPLGKEFSVTGQALVRSLCGAEETRKVVKIVRKGSCQTTGLYSMIYYYSDGTSERGHVVYCK